MSVLGNIRCLALFKQLEDGFVWAFAGIYGPNLDGSRRILWDEVASLCG